MAGGVAAANATCVSELSSSLADATGPGGLRATLVNVVLAGACEGSRGLTLDGHTEVDTPDCCGTPAQAQSSCCSRWPC